MVARLKTATVCGVVPDVKKALVLLGFPASETKGPRSSILGSC